MKQSYSIEEVVERTGVAARTIRKYDANGLLVPYPGRALVFTPQIVKRIQGIVVLQLFGFRTMEALKKAISLGGHTFLDDLMNDSKPLDVADGSWKTVRIVPGLVVSYQPNANPLALRIAQDLLKPFGEMVE